MLCKRFLQAEENRITNRTVLADLEASSSEAKLTEWREIEAKAREERHTNLEVMMPYEVRKEKGRLPR